MTEYLGQELAQRMSELAVGLQDEDTRDGTLRAIVDGALDLVPGTRWAGISLVRGSRVTVQASSDDLVLELDQLQGALGEGPCWPPQGPRRGQATPRAGPRSARAW